MGRSLSLLVARAPVLWPLLRRPTTRFWDRVAPAWEKRRVQADSNRLAAISAACDRLSAAPGRILDLGTGTGTSTRMLAERFPDAELVAVDISPEMIRIAQSLSPDSPRLSFQVADAAVLPFPDGSFDLVTQLNMPVYFAETARVLAPGGHVILASTLGPTTPYYTPHRLLRRRFARRGIELVETGKAGPGDYFLARRA